MPRERYANKLISMRIIRFDDFWEFHYQLVDTLKREDSIENGLQFYRNDAHEIYLQ